MTRFEIARAKWELLPLQTREAILAEIVPSVELRNDLIANNLLHDLEYLRHTHEEIRNDIINTLTTYKEDGL